MENPFTFMGKHLKRLTFTLHLLALAALSGCKQGPETPANALFELLPASSTGVEFNNEIATSDSINIMTYEYLYNGGGVGVGDFNNDSLPDLFFTGNMVPCALYVNQGSLAFEDITKKSGIDTHGLWAFGVSVVDINQDGWQDIYVCFGGRGNKNAFPNKLYINQHNLTFVESAKEYGLDDSGESIQADFFDYDLDGDLDMFLMQGGGFEKSAITPFPILKNGSGRNTDRLYRNNGGSPGDHPHFTDVSAEAGIQTEGFGLGVSILDVNGDHWPDVYVTNDYLSKDHLYVNNQNGTFTDEVDRYFKHISYFAMGNDVGDINNDGRMDVITLDMLPEDNYRRKMMFGPNQYDKFYFGVAQGYGFQYMRNTLQLANETGGYSEIGQSAGVAKTNWSWAPLLADFDNDGFQDLMISNGFGKDITNLDDVKFRQPVPGMTTAERRRHLLDRPAVDIPNYAYKNNGDNTFTNVTKSWGLDIPSLSNGMAYADLDRDGDLDLIVNNIDKPAFVYRNRLIERKTTGANFLNVRLVGPASNGDGIGANLRLSADTLVQVRELHPVRGFESTVENIIHFGIGKNAKADTLLVRWNDGKVSAVVNPAINKEITVSYASATAPAVKNQRPLATLLKQVTAVRFKHEENDFNDFLFQPLMQHKVSQEGPGIAVADVNKDGLEDFFVGGSYRLPAHMMIQNASGGFTVKEFAGDFESEDMGVLFFDADQDGDPDLFVVSGGNEFYAGHKNYQDRLYINDGSGNFKKDADAIPAEMGSGSCVVAGDYDADGDPDLFIGGRVTARQYPTTPHSQLLRNDKGKFVDVTSEVAPALVEAGMVTSALWTDFDNDHRIDLIVTGEAMPVRIFKNENGMLNDVTEKAGLKESNGFWNSLVSGDFDNDGDIDYIAGNLGNNGPMYASAKDPIVINYTDFDGNGSVEPVIGFVEEGVNHPVYPLDILTSQLPSLKKKILHHHDYAQMSMDEVLAITGNKNYKSLYCNVLKTSLIRNNGNGGFTLTPLPQQAQIAPVYGLVADDVDGDGNLDILGVGNSYAQEIVYGRMDALQGLVLLGDGKGKFKPVSAAASGFLVEGDGKGLVRIETARGFGFIATQNNDSIRMFLKPSKPGSFSIRVNPDEVAAVLTIDHSRKQKTEPGYGSTYLSQSSRRIPISTHVESVELFDQKGKSTRVISFKKQPNSQP